MEFYSYFYVLIFLEFSYSGLFPVLNRLYTDVKMLCCFSHRHFISSHNFYDFVFKIFWISHASIVLYFWVFGYIAPKIGCTPETLRIWYQKCLDKQNPIKVQQLSDQERIKQLERENKELQRANEILRKAAAFFAQAELDRPHK